MKKQLIRFAAASALVAAFFAPASAQTDPCADGTAACTDPVGFITITIKGLADFPSLDRAVTVIGLGMTNEVEFQSVMTGVSGATLDFAASSLSGLDFSGGYYLEIASGSSQGLIVDIASNTDSSITLTQDVSSALTGDESVKVREHRTVSSVFGTGASLILGESDTVTIFDGSNQQPITYTYSSRAGWGAAGGDGIIPLEAGVIINRREQSDVELKLLGSVKMEQTAFNVFSNANVIANPYPVAIPLDSINLNTESGDNGAIFDASTQNSVGVTYSSRSGWGVAGGALPPEIPAGGALILIHQGNGYSWLETAPF